MAGTRLSARALLGLATVLSAVTFGLRWWLASLVGFADAEALYACYAMHPQPVYLDHPGLVGSVMRALGGGGGPSPESAHRFAAIAATALPWLGAWAARATGATWRGSLRACLVLALAPEITIGLFSVHPDLLLCIAWVAALGFGGLALRSAPGSFRALLATLSCGACVALAMLAKVTGVLLGVALLVVWTARGRPHLRTLAPWAAIALAALLVAPAVVWEVQEGLPMLAHRLVATQADAGLSLRNLGALAGGQLLYVTPPFLWGAWRVHQHLRGQNPAPLALLLHAVWWPAIPLVALCLWSRVAEPHWLAPAYLGVALGVAHLEAPMPWVARACSVVGVAAIALSALWIGTSLPMRLLGSGYRPRYDLGNDLHAWRSTAPVVEAAVRSAGRGQPTRPVVVGPHWIVCAQAHAALGPDTPVGCLTPEGDDFDRWLPRLVWRRADTIVHVQDDRFEDRLAQAFPDRELVDERLHVVKRGGVTVRTFRISTLQGRGAVARVGGQK